MGQEMESLARYYLENKNLIFLTQNWSCRHGEIDLIMLDTNNILAFIEVRYRNNNLWGSPTESINAQKQKKIILTAQHFLQKNSLTHADKVCRFDIVAISNNQNELNVDWIKQAFDAT
ncbi:UNVERIFIED_CONTAM: hypothetical protein GTU68_056405 [Idotea baltica]|nr:hypothetical protein [Idotea baltica]